jgi:hypothetical protein
MKAPVSTLIRLGKDLRRFGRDVAVPVAALGRRWS